jgi:hypothetical protein
LSGTDCSSTKSRTPQVTARTGPIAGDGTFLPVLALAGQQFDVGLITEVAIFLLPGKFHHDAQIFQHLDGSIGGWERRIKSLFQ